MSRVTTYGPLFADTVLDDPREEIAILGTAFVTAAAHVNDRYRGPVETIHAHLTANPAF